MALDPDPFSQEAKFDREYERRQRERPAGPIQSVLGGIVLLCFAGTLAARFLHFIETFDGIVLMVLVLGASGGFWWYARNNPAK